ncbi:sensor histidine kinase [Nesterenkonia lutea]|uniref:histidine kinase n=1 Tax=Nesterenkonia lutea TaxID=272919 RepID=A0ABR9JGP2_9MICC|nr:histidine kinase [Nesterenkonia lutea]MBE1525100.1 signal transduction histidine kinase [Nesterenkonia lutea]
MSALTDVGEASSRNRQRLIDTLVKVLPLLVLLLFSHVGGQRAMGEIGWPVPWSVAVLIEVLTVASLAFSRTNPGAAAGTMAALCAAQLITGSAPGVSAFSVPFVVYACAKYGSPRVSRSCLALALLGAAALGVYFVLIDLTYASQYQEAGVTQETFWGLPVRTLGSAALTGGFAGAIAVVFWLAGHLAGRRRREIAAISERNQLLIRERDQEARLAADAERMRIAREMHDVISHSMSVMIAQADGGRYVLQQSPERAAQAFETISETGREALTEMRRMLGVLREGDGALQKRPAPGVQDLPQLVEDVTASGLQVQLHMLSESIPRLPEGVGLAAYRIVQEALTNTLKHGGPQARAEVWVAVAAESGPALMLEIRDTGHGAAVTSDGGGSGLLGMVERARLYGGTVQTRAHERGFDVLARFPLGGETTTAGAQMPAESTREGEAA